jgi:hypothetical protein
MRPEPRHLAPSLALPLALALAALFTLTAAPAAAEKVRLPTETFGSAAQPSFAAPQSLAVDQSSGDLLVADAGRSEVQQITVAATAGTFKLTFGAQTTADLAFNAGAQKVREALWALSSVGPNSVSVSGGPGDAAGSKPYIVSFAFQLAKTDVEQIACADGAAPLSGGAGCSVATTTQGVDQTIGRYHPNGTPHDFSALGTNLIDGRGGADQTPLGGLLLASAGVGQIAIDESAGPTAGDIYVSEQNRAQVSIFSPTGAYLGRIQQAKTVPFFSVCGVAVSTTGAAYLADPNYGRVYEFLPVANPATDADYKAPFFDSGVGNGPCNLALGADPTAGFLFVSTSSGPYAGIAKWDIAGRAVQYVFGASGSNQPLTIHPATGRVLAFEHGGFGASKITEYDASGPSSATVLSTATVPPGASGGIAVRAATDELYVSRGATAGVVDVYGPPLPVPTLSAKPATAIAPTGATLNGTVNPEGIPVTECSFEYLSEAQWAADGETFASAESAPCEGAIPADSSEHPVSASISALSPATKYIFRLAAANANGDNQSGEETFKTALPLATAPATAIAGTKATLNGVVFPQGAPITECSFEYGTTTAYGQTVPCQPEAGEIPADEAEHKVSADIDHLVPNGTTYHFRITASGGFGTLQGQDLSFTTADTVITKPATAISGTSATLNGTVNPEGIPLSACSFEYGTTTAYGQSAPCAEPGAAEVGAGSSPLAVHADLTGLALGTAYHFRLTATNADGTATGKDHSFTTLGPPVIEDQWAASVVFAEASIAAEVNPEGSPTTYRVEYGTDAAYGQSSPELDLGADDRSPHALARFLDGLQPATTYHYRFLAFNQYGESAGPDASFTTYAHPEPQTDCPNQAYRTGPAATLPDCRAYEMVSPPDKNGGSIGAEVTGLSQSSPDGERLAFPSDTAFAGNASSLYPNQYIAGRGVGGWSTEGIDPPLQTPGATENPFGLRNRYYTLTPDLSSAWNANDSASPLTPEAQPGYENLYRRDNQTGSFEALTVSAPIEVEGQGPYLAGELVGYSLDLGHQVFAANGKLTPDAAASTGKQIYDLSGGSLHLVSVLPDGSAAAGGVTVGVAVKSQTAFGSGQIHRAVSEDGSRVFWRSGNNPHGSGTVYVRLNPLQPESAAKDGAGNCLPEPERACTIQLSPGSESNFLTATPDGSRALLLSGKSLAVNAALSLVDIASAAATPIAAGLPGQQPTYLANSGFLGAAEDLSRVYFVSEEDLDSAGPATAGAFNLYAWHEGAYAYIAKLSADDVQPGSHPNSASLDAITHNARVSPDGRFAAFVSNRSLTGYDNADLASGEADREVYLYDAAAEKLTCLSCNPSGARPSGDLSPEEIEGFKEPKVRPAAAVLPAEGASVYYATRPLAEDGRRVFFEAHDPLLPRDTNGTWDVYEWEAPGSGSCRESDPDYFERNEGCLSLISTGTDPQPAEFFDADQSGDNAFIRTAAALDPRDLGAYDVYDARVAGGFPLPTEPAACEGEACQTPPPPPNRPTPASSVLAGDGNVSEEGACPKGKVRRKGRCVSKRCPRGKVRRKGRCVSKRCPKGRVRRHRKCVKKRKSHRRRAANATRRLAR